MPQPPSRRDIVKDRQVLHHHAHNLRGLDPGFQDGRFATPQPLAPGPSLLVGGNEGGDTEDVEQVLWEDGDRHYVWTPGTQLFQLSHIPIDESLLLHWHASTDSAGVEWKRGDHYDVDDNGAVTIYSFTRGGETWPKRGQVFSAQYPYREGAEDENGEVFLNQFEVLAWDNTPTLTGIILETGVSYRIYTHGNFCIDGPFPESNLACGNWTSPAGDVGFLGPQADAVGIWQRAPSESARWTGPWGASNPVQYRRSTSESWLSWAAVRTSEFRYSGLILPGGGDPCGPSSDIIVGTGGELQFRFEDSPPFDNNGSITFYVWETGL